MPSQTRSRWTVSALLAVLTAVAVGACSTAATTGPGTAPATSAGGSPGSGDTAAAEQYCTTKGGMLVDRVATWNTNADPSAWLQLAGRWRVCEFETGSGDQATRISVDLTTLSSPEPTIAAIAYLSKVRTTSPPQPSANPADWSCRNDYLGASSFGNTASVGGWVDQSQPVFKVMDYCVFADGSAIDEFGLWYHANGAIRGADLAPLFAYQPGGKLPAMFQSGR